MEVILEALGGIVVGLKGEVYNYESEGHKNNYGVFAINSRLAFDQLIPKFREFYEKEESNQVV